MARVPARQKAALAYLQETPRTYTIESSARSSGSPAPPRISRNIADKNVELLRSGALHAARSMRLDQLFTKEGFDLVIEVSHRKVFPLESIGAKDIFVQGQLIGCPVSRHGGDPMTSPVGRRRRWWNAV